VIKRSLTASAFKPPKKTFSTVKKNKIVKKQITFRENNSSARDTYQQKQLHGKGNLTPYTPQPYQQFKTPGEVRTLRPPQLNL
jgi:hypothetical protein